MLCRAWREYGYYWIITIYPSHMDHDRIAVLLIWYLSNHHFSRRLVTTPGGSQVITTSTSNFPGGAIVTPSRNGTHVIWVMSWVMSNLCNFFPLKKMLPWKLRWPLQVVVVERQAIPSKMVPIPEDMLNIVKLLVLQGVVSVATSCSSSTGIVEWVLDTETLGEILVGSGNTDGAHQRPELPTGKCRWPCSTRDLQVCCSRYGFPGP